MRPTLLLASLLLLAAPAAWAQHAPLGLNLGHHKAASSSLEAEKSAWLAHASSYRAAHASSAAHTTSTYSAPKSASVSAPDEEAEKAAWRAHASSYRKAHYPSSAASSVDSAKAAWGAHAKSYSMSKARDAARASASAWRASVSAASASKAAQPHIEEKDNDKAEIVSDGPAKAQEVKLASAASSGQEAVSVSDPATTVHPPPTAPVAVDPKETNVERVAWLSHAASVSFARAQESAKAHASSWEAHAASVRASRSKAAADSKPTTTVAPSGSKRAF